MPSGRGCVSFSRSWRILPSDFGKFPPLGLLYIAAALREKGFGDVRVVDAGAGGMTPEAVGRIVSSFKPHLIGISSFTVTFAETLRIADTAKAACPDAHVCVGGPHVKTFPALTIAHKNIDSAIVGEGEEIFPLLAESLFENGSGRLPEGVITKHNATARGNAAPHKVGDLDSLPFPARDLLSNIRYNSVVGIRPRCVSVVTSRGCPCRCTFCDVPFKEIRLRSVENVLEEIGRCAPGPDTEIFFFDDTFNITEARLAEFGRGLAGRFRVPWSFRGRVGNLNKPLLREIAGAGCFQIHLGVETCGDENLRRLKKDTTVEQIRLVLDAARGAGIRVIANLMIALPFEKTEGDIYGNIRNIMRLNPHLVQINVLRLIPGTEIFEDAVSRGIVSWADWESYVKNPGGDFTPKTWDEHIPRERLGRIWRKCYWMFYFRPSKIMEIVLRIRSFGEFKTKFINGLKLLRPRSMS